MVDYELELAEVDRRVSQLDVGLGGVHRAQRGMYYYPFRGRVVRQHVYSLTRGLKHLAKLPARPYEGGDLSNR